MGTVKYQNRDSSGGGLIEKGKVALQVIDDMYTCDKVSEKGNEYMNLVMKQVGRYNEVTQDWERIGGGNLFEKLTFTEKSAWRIDNFLNSCGKAPAIGENVEVNASKTIGWVAYCDVVHEDSDNERYPKNAVISSYIKTNSEYHPKYIAPVQEVKAEPVQNDSFGIDTSEEPPF